MAENRLSEAATLLADSSALNFEKGSPIGLAFNRRAFDALQQALDEARDTVKKNFYADFFWLVNVCGFLIQALLVSRIFKYAGVRIALVILPVIAVGGYVLIAAVGGVLLIRLAKTAENSTDYSLQTTVRQALFLPTSREVKYKAKAAIDTFFVRIGDAMSAGLVYLGIHHLRFDITGFAVTNVALILLWIAIVIGIARIHKQMAPDDRDVAI